MDVKGKWSPGYAGQICDYINKVFIRKIIKVRIFWKRNDRGAILATSPCRE